MNKVYWGEVGYLRLLGDVLDLGFDTPDRTGIGCRKLLNVQLCFDLWGSFPVHTVRPCSARLAFEEFWLFLRGDTDTKILEKKGINFWKGHTSREFLDSRGLHHVKEGDLHKSYSYQMRGLGEGYVDQLATVYEGLKNDPFSRRHLITLWNVNDLSSMPLTPCWFQTQFHVEPGEINKLHLTVTSRSCDLVFGTPFNYQQYALYLLAMSKLVGMRPGVLTCNMADCHIYENQIEYVKEVCERSVYPGFVGATINKDLKSLEDLTSLVWDDFVYSPYIVNSSPFKAKKPGMAI